MAIGTLNYNLAGFIDEVLEILRGLFDNAYIPDNPDINPGSWPYATVYMSNGTSKGEPAGYVQKDLSDVTIAVIVPLDDMARAIQFLLPYREQIPNALFKWFYKDGPQSQHAQHIGTEMTLNLGPLEWPSGQNMFGWLITLNEVKIQNEIT